MWLGKEGGAASICGAPPSRVSCRDDLHIRTHVRFGVFVRRRRCRRVVTHSVASSVEGLAFDGAQGSVLEHGSGGRGAGLQTYIQSTRGGDRDRRPHAHPSGQRG